MPRHRARNSRDTSPPAKDADPIGLRIIGGEFRGRKLRYGGDRRVRPMKDRVREAVFNLIGPAIRGTHAVDLFAGTGALGLEAISRGAARATFIEQHFPTAAIVRQNIASLGLEDRCEVITANVLLWAERNQLPCTTPWTVFSSPPYDFYVDRLEAMLVLLNYLLGQMPRESRLVVEADERFDFALLPEPESWDVRSYPPAVVGIRRKG